MRKRIPQLDGAVSPLFWWMPASPGFDAVIHTSCLAAMPSVQANFTWKAGRELDSGGDVILAAALAKKFAGRVTVPAITACIQAMGANGLRQDSALGRHLAGAKIAAFTDGSTEMMNERIGVSIRRERL